MSTDTPLKCIPDTFAGADVFVTGGSGFMGKVLLEKLLRSCPDIGKVFVLLRPRKGKCPEERVSELVQIPLFDKLREIRPDDVRKVIPVSGDCAQLKMGLDDGSFKQIENVQFVFHAAASVRFDDPLEKAILLNTRGTREVIQWAKTLKKLRALVHISTTYCNPEIFEVEERIYPAKMNWRRAIEMAENLDSDILETLSQKITGFAPNTYTFTKGLAEQICYEYHKELPVVIFRPSVVTNTEYEPVPGWIDNFNGPMALLLGCGTGVLRTSYLNVDNRLNCIPADVSIKAIIIAAWKKASSAGSEFMIYNCAADVSKTFDYNGCIEIGKHIIAATPMTQMFWAPGGSNAFCLYWYYLTFFLYQCLPSLCADGVIKLTGRKPFLLRLQRKIFYSQLSLKYFTDNEWVFKTDNFRSLANELLESDRQNFNIAYMCHGMVNYYSKCILGARRYLFKDKDETIPAARRKYERLMILHRLLKLTLFSIFMYFLFNKYNV